MEGYIIIKDFENYEINKQGEIRNIKTKYILGGCINSRGYKVITLSKDRKKTNVYLHRLLGIAFIDNPDNKPYIDHINGDKSDNDLSNLRWVNEQENSSNKIKQPNKSSQYKGVSYVKKTGKWGSSIKINGRTIHFSTSETEEEANKKRIEYIQQNNLKFY